jgi:hypothetical protein
MLVSQRTIVNGSDSLRRLGAVRDRDGTDSKWRQVTQVRDQREESDCPLIKLRTHMSNKIDDEDDFDTITRCPLGPGETLETRLAELRHRYEVEDEYQLVRRIIQERSSYQAEETRTVLGQPFWLGPYPRARELMDAETMLHSRDRVVRRLFELQAIAHLVQLMDEMKAVLRAEGEKVGLLGLAAGRLIRISGCVFYVPTNCTSITRTEAMGKLPKVYRRRKEHRKRLLEAERRYRLKYGCEDVPKFFK